MSNPHCQFGTGSLSKPKGLWQEVGSKRGGWGDIGEWEPTPNMRSDWYRLLFCGNCILKV